MCFDFDTEGLMMLRCWKSHIKATLIKCCKTTKQMPFVDAVLFLHKGQSSYQTSKICVIAIYSIIWQLVMCAWDVSINMIKKIYQNPVLAHINHYVMMCESQCAYYLLVMNIFRVCVASLRHIFFVFCPNTDKMTSLEFERWNCP